MTPQFKDLTDEQKETVRALRAEIRDLDLQADEAWARYIKTGDKECYNAVRALESEIEMKGLIAYLPKAGEGKVKRVMGLINQIKGQPDDTEACEGCEQLPEIVDVRVRTLDSINEWRDSFGLPALERLPAGVVGDASDCVIARAFSSIDTLNFEGKDWQVNKAFIGGGGDSRIELFDPETGFSMNLDIEAPDMAAWDRFITTFDEGDHWDLVDEDSLSRRACDAAEEYGTSNRHFLAALEAVFQRGMVDEFLERWARHSIGYYYNAKFEDGKFVFTPTEESTYVEVKSYQTGTVSPIVGAMDTLVA